ncbi:MULTISPECIES: signal peptidase II [unclassified Shinella]|jgi:signal peptidase II|uniref:signal peptidase II n=1 Tax=unclassified Shinella TaxID=2643062 RepID=UPI00068115F5|nr:MULTISPECIES: signal peptidase II [unclassified Shinella]KNY18727.1 lipoprotein signal peptidase [Shinella sp. SUS2]KOC76577.1 lipoprotein signal peptidase [Shinella sp. GWS1]MCO5155065.1 signal peptidase II [Shinella sp.]MDC7260427.1 signal peptidase II [Shinella sp. HY16]MDC7267322.1 signal peptidase II [Shinella sp. YZ44]
MSERIPLMSRPIPVVVVILLALAVDQVVKFAVEMWLPFQEAVHVMPMLALYRTYNYGVAFSMLSGMETWFIIALRLFVVGFVVWLWRQTPKARGVAHAGYAFIIAGAFGNIIDKVIFGYVIDYVLFYTETWSFAVFNLADTFITIGAALVILDELLLLRRRDR